MVFALSAAAVVMACSYIPLTPPPTTPQASPSPVLTDPIIGPVAGL